MSTAIKLREVADGVECVDSIWWDRIIGYMRQTFAVMGALSALSFLGLGCRQALLSRAGGPDGGGGSSSTAPMGSAGAAASGGGAGGGATFTVVDPEVSRTWRWSSCGSIPPMTTSAVQAIFPPAGDALAVLYDDGSVMLHATDYGAAPTMLRPKGTPPTSIAFSLDGTELAEVAAGVVRVRDVATGTMLRDMAVNAACTGDAVRFSAEGDHVLAWDDTSLCVWRTADGSLAHRWSGELGLGAREGKRHAARRAPK